MLPASGVTCQVEPEDEAYCTDQPSTLTVSLPLLCSSMKSLFRVAPELPPPPYTWLITTCACAAQTPQDNSKASASRRANLFIATPLVRMILPMGRSPHRECPILPQHARSRLPRRGVTGFVAKMRAGEGRGGTGSVITVSWRRYPYNQKKK